MPTSGLFNSLHGISNAKGGEGGHGWSEDDEDARRLHDGGGEEQMIKVIEPAVGDAGFGVVLSAEMVFEPVGKAVDRAGPLGLGDCSAATSFPIAVGEFRGLNRSRQSCR